MPASAFRLALKSASAFVFVASAAIAFAAPASAQFVSAGEKIGQEAPRERPSLAV